MATFPRRMVAVLIDWLLCQLIAYGAFSVSWGEGGPAGLVPLAVFYVENILLVSTLGTTVGQRLLGLQVRSALSERPVLVRAWVDRSPSLGTLGGAPGFKKAFARSVLLCLFVPALIPDRDGRGMHDRAAGTVIVRVR